jgi:hypothetical protein
MRLKPLSTSNRIKMGEGGISLHFSNIFLNTFFHFSVGPPLGDQGWEGGQPHKFCYLKNLKKQMFHRKDKKE